MPVVACKNPDCGNTFEPKSCQHKFCSKTCNNLHYNRDPEHPIRKHLATARVRAEKKGLEFNITLEDLEIPEFCPILNIKLEACAGPASYSLDRIDSNKGYIKGNVHVVSWRANELKKNGTLEEFEKLVDWMKSNVKGTIKTNVAS